MANVRVLPPPSGQQLTITVNGRTYTAVANSFLDVPDFDAAQMLASGWIAYVPRTAGVGATAARPTTNQDGTFPVRAGTNFLDTTLNKIVVADGLGNFRDYTGAVV